MTFSPIVIFPSRVLLMLNKFKPESYLGISLYLLKWSNKKKTKQQTSSNLEISKYEQKSSYFEFGHLNY